MVPSYQENNQTEYCDYCHISCGVRNARGSLRIANAEYTFLVLEIAHSEADKKALTNAKY